MDWVFATRPKVLIENNILLSLMISYTNTHTPYIHISESFLHHVKSTLLLYISLSLTKYHLFRKKTNFQKKTNGIGKDKTCSEFSITRIYLAYLRTAATHWNYLMRKKRVFEEWKRAQFHLFLFQCWIFDQEWGRKRKRKRKIDEKKVRQLQMGL